MSDQPRRLGWCPCPERQLGLMLIRCRLQAARMDAPDLDLDELFLDTLEAVVLAALEQIGDDPGARFRFFRRLLAVAEEETVRTRLS
jgi:hypothetical protein